MAKTTTELIKQWINKERPPFTDEKGKFNLQGMKAFMEEVQQYPSKAKKSKKIECSWNFDEGKPLVTSTIQHARGETLLQADFAPFMGGEGLAPDPIQYCLFGLAACFAGTFMSVATMMGIEIQETKLEIGQRAKDFLMDDNSYSSDLKGSVIFLVFWKSL